MRRSWFSKLEICRDFVGAIGRRGDREGMSALPDDQDAVQE